MEARPFLDPAGRPGEEALRTVLGSAACQYQKLMDCSEAFSREWNFSRKGGWMLKVCDSKKALFYLIPLNNAFIVSLAIREKEREVFLVDEDQKALQPMLAAAKKFIEGYALQFTITNEDDYRPVEALMEKLIAVRLSK